MKSVLLSLSLLFIGTASVFAKPDPLPVSKNLIFEGNFAEHTGTTPAGWSEGGFAGGDHGNTVKVTDDRDGNYITLFVAKSASAHFTLSLKEQVSLRPTWKALLCSVDMRVFNYDQGAQSYFKPRMHITFVDDAGKEIQSVGVNLGARYTDAWQTAEKEVPIPAGATAAKVWLGSFGSTGQLEFRNPYIAPIEAVE